MGETSRKILKAAKKGLRVRTVIFFILILVLNTCAWYIYVSEVSSDITTHVKSWHIEIGDNVSQNVDFSIENIYPGMENETQTVEITNRGELPASINCEILQMSILGTLTVADGTTITSESLIHSIANDYPFKLKFYINEVETTQILLQRNETCRISMEVTWPFDSGDDEADTYWGNSAYSFIEDNPDETCIQIKAKIKADQVQ